LGTGTLSGRVVIDDTGKPARRVMLILSGGNVRASKTATSDDLGTYSFTQLGVGTYTLSGSKPGFVNVIYGQKKPNRPGTPIGLADGQKIEGITLRIPRGGVITGAVLDDNMDPTPGTQVRVMRYQMNTGVKQLTQAGTGVTDDRGIYRVYGLAPGDYIITATPRLNINDIAQMVQNVAQTTTGAAGQGGQGGFGAGGGRGAAAGGGAGGLGANGNGFGGPGGRGGGIAGQILNGFQQDSAVGYAPVYYPGTTTAANATVVTVGVSETKDAIDFQLQLVQTAKLSGVVSSPDGNPQGVMLTLVNDQEDAGSASGPNTARVQQDGKFTFSNVMPGQYTISARGGGGGRGGRGGGPNQATTTAGTAAGGRGGGAGRGGQGDMLWGESQVSVDGHNVSDITVAMQPGMMMSGHITFEGTGPTSGAGATAGQPPNPTRVRVTLSSASTGGGGMADLSGPPASAQVDADGNFSMTGVPPGKYYVRASGATGFNSKSALYQGRDALDFPLEVKPGEDVAAVAITLSDKTTLISGTLQDPSGQPTSDYTIIVYPNDKRFWLPQSRRIQSTRPGTDGTYRVGGLPPGDYRLAAVTDVEPGEWFDPVFLNQLANASTVLSLAEGDTKTQDLRLSGGGTR
jgi:hypothetical protein